MIAKAQNGTADTLSYKKKAFKSYPSIMMNGQKLNKDELLNIFSKVPEANTYFLDYKKQYKSGNIAMIAHLGLLGVTAAGIATSNKRLASTALLLSLTSFVVSVSFKSSGDKKLRMAINTYNHH